jgi:hypothetical protein
MLLNDSSYLFKPKSTIKEVREAAKKYNIDVRSVAFMMWLTIPNIDLVGLINLLEIGE